MSVCGSDVRYKSFPRQLGWSGFLAGNLRLLNGGCGYMDVSENRGVPPKSSHFNRVFHYKPSILGYPYFWKHPYHVDQHIANMIFQCSHSIISASQTRFGASTRSCDKL